MVWLAGIVKWIVSDIRHIIIIALSVLLIGAVIYVGYLRWDVAAKDSRISELKISNATLDLNNKNLTAANDQLRVANAALQKYANDIMTIKKNMADIKAKVTTITSKEDEINANNALVDIFDNKPTP